MHWLVDGNNLMHLLPELMWTTPDAGQPAALAALIKPYRDAKSLKITIFFDGGEDMRQTRLSGVAVFFSGPEKNADELILERMKNDKGFGLISNDQALCAVARGMGAQTVSASIFAQKLKADYKIDHEDSEGWNFSTRKKGASRRLPKAKRRQSNL